MPSSVHTWLSGELATAVAASFEGLTGDRPRVETHELASEPPQGNALRWCQKFSSISGALWIGCSDADWHAAGLALMQAVGVDEKDPAKLKAEFSEVLRQALSAVASAMSARLGREILAAGGGESDAPAAGAAWSALAVTGNGWSATVAFGIESSLAAALEIHPPEPKSKTYELLLDVELPVSISFGRAQVPLKDVLKLTTGSVVDLNRDISDPVEVIVNNCVIARGEVVVVGGNFGVRIQQVISRQDRIRTLK